ncbi:MAG: 1-(5-phosphoribosyl)-5-[(5-phosphoribosylamino)methylideneamino]imidazole-4-carboxamide isomerase [Candidatus Omnitrophica bacterium]|nr:1-(5-phosphoribosyl)-5-[(5-phosphoribosylamino)methylideneamino]imidazole-4-carboxamide isomerase [Candidatus Omnitrophota bacterium]
MILIPAIDIRNGNVVRLHQGNYEKETVYSSDPVAMAQQWVDEGAKMLHVVDLDGAREGLPYNIKAIENITRAVSIPIELGGGLRTVKSVRTVLDDGVRRAVIGTKALDETLIKRLIEEFGSEQIVVGIDVVHGTVKTDGWLQSSGLSIEAVCDRIINCGVLHVIFTDIVRDGTLKGPNIESLKRVLSFKELKVVASGGIGSLDDIRTIVSLRAPNLFGIIIGKALYEGKISLRDACNMIT